jgi:hypothetical protein
LFTEAIAKLESEVVVFGNCFNDWDAKSPCFVAVDGTDMAILEPWPYNPVWWSHKFNGAGIKYEVATCIKTGDIVWLNGPFPCAMQDREIFDWGLKTKLIPGEKVEADSGYTGRTQIATPAMGKNHVARKQKSQCRGRQENTNKTCCCI